MKIVVKDFGTSNVHYKQEVDGYSLLTGESFDNTIETLLGNIVTDIATCKEIRDEVINTHISTWGSMTDYQKKLCIEIYAYPIGTPTTELDLLYSEAIRYGFKKSVINSHLLIGCQIATSTQDSSININSTYNDTGVLTTVIIEPYLIIQ